MSGRGSKAVTALNYPQKVGHKTNFMSKKYTMEEKLRVIELYKRGLGNRMISKETGCERSAVKWWLRPFRTPGRTGQGLE